MNKTMKRIALLAACLIVVGVIGDAWVFLSGRWSSDTQAEQGVYELSEQDVQRLEVDLRKGKLTIVAGDVDKPTVRYWISDALGATHDGGMVQEKRQGDLLRLELGEGWLGDTLPRDFKQKLFGDGWRELRYELQLPRRMYKQLALDISGGEAEATGISAQDFTVRVHSGSVKLNDIEANALGVALESGSLKADGIKAAELTGRIAAGKAELRNVSAAADLNMSSGVLELELARLENDVKLQAHSGKLKVKLSRIASPYLLDVNARSGALDIDLPDAKYKGGGTNHFRQQIGGNGGPTVKIEASSGKVDID